MSDGVGGTTLAPEARLTPFFAGVTMVSERLLGRRLGGLGGRLKEGFAVRMGASSGADSLFSMAMGNAVAAPRGLPRLPVVLTARFLRFRARLPGVNVRVFSSKNEDDDCCGVLLISSAVCGRRTEVFAIGDSGDDPGDISVTLESSANDNVVVGDDPVDSEADVDVLPLCWCDCAVYGLYRLSGDMGKFLAILSSRWVTPSDWRPSSKTSGILGRNLKWLSDLVEIIFYSFKKMRNRARMKPGQQAQEVDCLPDRQLRR